MNGRVVFGGLLLGIPIAGMVGGLVVTCPWGPWWGAGILFVAGVWFWGGVWLVAVGLDNENPSKWRGHG